MCASGDRRTSNQIVLTGTALVLKRSVLSSNSRKTKDKTWDTHENTHTEVTTGVMLFNSKSKVVLQLTQHCVSVLELGTEHRAALQLNMS